MRYRAVAMDVDGTITDDNLLICPEAINGIRRLKKLGLDVIICSGNVLPIAYAISFYTGARGPIVAENGGVVYADGEVFVLAEQEKAVEAFEFLKGKVDVKRLFTDRWRESEVGFYQDVPVQKVKEILRGYDVLVESSGYAIHIMPNHLTKMDGIRFLSDLIGISTDEIIAIGDGDNDARMLKGCAYGIALANASEKAKESADHITKERHGKGFLEAVELIEKMLEK